MQDTACQEFYQRYNSPPVPLLSPAFSLAVLRPCCKVDRLVCCRETAVLCSFVTVCSAGLDYDKELHEAVVDFAASTLYDEDVLLASAIADFYSCLSVAEFAGMYTCGFDAEVGTYCLGKAWVGS